MSDGCTDGVSPPIFQVGEGWRCGDVVADQPDEGSGQMSTIDDIIQPASILAPVDFPALARLGRE